MKNRSAFFADRKYQCPRRVRRVLLQGAPRRYHTSKNCPSPASRDGKVRRDLPISHGRLSANSNHDATRAMEEADPGRGAFALGFWGSASLHLSPVPFSRVSPTQTPVSVISSSLSIWGQLRRSDKYRKVVSIGLFHQAAPCFMLLDPAGGVTPQTARDTLAPIRQHLGHRINRRSIGS